MIILFFLHFSATQQTTAAASPNVSESTVSNTSLTTATTASTTEATSLNTSLPTTQSATSTTPAPGSVEESLLVGQPPGTVIKCVTAQVIHTTQGPRIVLQGLQGTDFTPNQLSMVHQQVKQQLVKAQETAGKQGVLGPTKIYLAVQPPPNAVKQETPSQNADISKVKSENTATQQSEDNTGKYKLNF